MIEKHYVFMIEGDNGFLVGMRTDGTLEYGPDYTPDKAARIFWETMMVHSPVTTEFDSQPLLV